MIRFPFGKTRAEDPKPDAENAAENAAAKTAPPAATPESKAALETDVDLEIPSFGADLDAADRAEIEPPLERRDEAVERAQPPAVAETGSETPSEAFDDTPSETPAETLSEEADPFELAGRPSMLEQIRMVEAMLFASDKPLSTLELTDRMPVGCDAAVAVRRLEEQYQNRGVRLARIAGKWAFRTAPDLAHLMVGEAVEQRKLSRAAIETLAIIAYHQPVTRAEIEEIRQVGVSKGTIDLLMELGWVKLGRRRQSPGRPVTFITTDVFLDSFGLESVKDLPGLDELRQAGLLDARPPVGFEPTDDPERPYEAEEEDLDPYAEDEEDAEARRRGQEELMV